MPAHPARLLAAFTLTLCLAAGSPPTLAKERDVQLIKIAYMYNFLKFVRWPLPHDSEMRMCFARAPDLALEAQTALRDKHVMELPVRVVPITEPARAEGCALLYVPQVTAASSVQGVLTVGEGREFVEAGGMIGFTIVEDRVRFVVNLKTLREAGLSADAKLLTVALDVLQ